MKKNATITVIDTELNNTAIQQMKVLTEERNIHKLEANKS